MLRCLGPWVHHDDTKTCDTDGGMLTTGEQPLNHVARYVAGVVDLPKAIAAAQDPLGPFIHDFLALRELHFHWFNVLVLGIWGGLEAARKKLEMMRETVADYVEATRKELGWSDKWGCFLQCYPHADPKHFFLCHIV